MNNVSVNEVSINGEVYVKKSIVPESSVAEEVDGMRYCIVRTYSAGVFAGYIKEREGKECTLINARRIWRWSGAASLSELAVKGSYNPDGCKFPCAVNEVFLTEAIEIIPCTEKSKSFIENHTIWSAENE